MELGAYAQQLCLMPDTPGRKDVLLSIRDRLPGLNRHEQSAVMLAMLISAQVIEGPRSEMAARLEQQHGSALSAEARRQLKELRRDLAGEDPYVAAEDPVSIYDLCCTAFEPLDEDEPIVRSGPKIGRNDPCWCGSGKKYKKCHLDADEG